MHQKHGLLSLLTRPSNPRSKGLIHFYSGFEAHGIFTKDEILAEALQRAAAWKPNLNSGAPVILALDNGPEFLFSFFGLMAAFLVSLVGLIILLYARFR